MKRKAIVLEAHNACKEKLDLQEKCAALQAELTNTDRVGGNLINIIVKQQDQIRELETELDKYKLKWQTGTPMIENTSYWVKFPIGGVKLRNYPLDSWHWWAKAGVEWAGPALLPPPSISPEK